MKEQEINDLVSVIENSFQAKERIAKLEKEILSAKRKKDKKRVKELYSVALKICLGRDWYDSASKIARIAGDTDTAELYKERHKDYLHQIFQTNNSTQVYERPRQDPLDRTDWGFGDSEGW